MKSFYFLLPFLVCAAVSRADEFADESAPSDPAVKKLPAVLVRESPSIADKYQLPQVTESITASRFAETVNAMDAEDAVKYLPSVFLRKRNYGDTQAVMATRVWGVSSSARSLVYADGLLLTALVANNNTIGAPRWGLISPAEIERVDLMYGPFAAAYPGNSMGAVMEITTRMPEAAIATIEQTMAWQDFHLYGTHHIFRTTQTAFTVGDRAGAFSFWVSGNYQDSFSQPLGYVTSALFPAATSGGYVAANKLGQPANILGATGLLHTRMSNAKVKAAYDFSPALRATYTYGWWHNDADSAVETFLRDAAGRPTYAGLAGFASGYSHQIESHSSHSLSLKTDTKRDWNFEAIASRYRFDRDAQHLPSTASVSGTDFSTAGRVAVLGGTHWTTLDLKGTWRPGDGSRNHEASFGLHDDHYVLYNPTFNTPDWRQGETYSSVSTEGDGKTRTQAVWMQDVWQLASTWKATLGLRYEKWRAYDGFNANGSTAVHQPSLTADNFSPKATLTWTGLPQWEITASVGKAYRYATAAELYQLISTGSTFTSPNPNLKPDDVIATEVKFERKLARGRVRLSLFQDDIHDAILAQFQPLVPGSSTLFQFISNVDHVRARGAEVVFQREHVLLPGLEITGSVTYVDATVLASQGQGQFGSAKGKRLPNIPDWRGAFTATYRIAETWSFTAAGRYSGKLFTTLDNNDVNPNTYQGFTSFFVGDFRARTRLNAHWSTSLGVDNVLNRTYFFFHPFPQRTVITEARYAF